MEIKLNNPSIWLHDFCRYLLHHRIISKYTIFSEPSQKTGLEVKHD